MKKKLNDVLHLFEDNDKKFIKEVGFDLNNEVVDDTFQEFIKNDNILQVTFEKGFTSITDINLWSKKIQTELDKIGY